MLNKGDRVVYEGENFQEFGIVRWIGKAHANEIGSEVMAGVEFDNPVANDNHKINGHWLFEALPHHGTLLPASSLMLVEDEVAPIDRGYKKFQKQAEMPLGTDMSSLSTFHKMAYDCLASSSKPMNIKNPLNTSYGDKENFDILPHMSYNSYKNIHSNNSKETLNDMKNKSLKSKSCRGPLAASIFDEKRSYSKSTTRPTTLVSTNKTSIGVCGRGIMNQEDDETDFAQSPTGYHPHQEDDESDFVESPSGYHPLMHLSHHGIDQLDVVSEGDGMLIEEGKLLQNEDVDIGSMVEVLLKDIPRPLCGVIRWIGLVSGDKKEKLVTGIEMEDAEDGLSDGTLKGKRYFSCSVGKALFVPITMCAKDSRFLESLSSNPRASLAFGSTDCQPIMGNVAPLTSSDNVKSMFGRNKGIQGHQNSCYLDATLFSMFAFTSVFDSLLFRPQSSEDIKEYGEVQSVLREEIVNPLRKNMFVRADRIMKLRTMLDHFSSVSGLTTEEKDPEEFLQSLLAQIFRAEPFLQLSSGQEAYHYQLFVDKDDKLNLPSVQTLFDQSFLTSDIKLKEIPSCLIIQMPRFGKDYKMYPRILPSMILDVTDVIEDSPRQCIICGKLAEYECKECYGQCGSGLESIAFCTKCMDKAHSHKRRGCHSSTRKLKIPAEFQMLADHCGTIPRVYMELFAVVCIKTSHYVTFTRCGSGADATWCFFDSMADRKGEQHGYNIPSVVECGDLMQWVGEESSQMLHSVTDNNALPDLPRRLLCDAFMCFYQSSKVMMYK